MSEQELIMTGKMCPYCKGNSELIDSSVIYGKSYGMIYLCRRCDAYVGTHKGDNTSALGRLANKELREAKKQAHFFFDQIWKLKIMDRTEAYDYMSRWLEVDREDCHIGMFDVDMCLKVVDMAKDVLNTERRLDLDFGAEPKTPYYER